MKKTVFLLNILFIALSLILDIALIISGLYPFKVPASVCFMAAALVNLYYVLKYIPQMKNAAIPLTLGVAFAMSADIVIYLNFIGGAVLFAAGHISYIICYCILQRFRLSDLIPAIALFVPCSLFMILFPAFNYGGTAMELMCLAYALIISVMTGKAVMNRFRKKTALNLFLALGSILFLISDIMLLMSSFTDSGIPFEKLCLSIYYPGQCLIAHGFYHAENHRLKSK